MNDMGRAFGCLLTIAIAGIIIMILFGGYIGYDFFKEEKIESNKIIIPEIRLETDGKIIDTIYVYKNQQQ